VNGENVSIDYLGIEERRQARTDLTGRFKLAGLPAGTAKLAVYSMRLDQGFSEKLEVSASNSAMRLQLLPSEPVDTSSAVTLLGMKLIDLTPELQRKYKLYNTTGVLVLEPPADQARLGIGELAKGDVFWMAGKKRVSNMKEFAEEILRVNSLPKPVSFIDEGYTGSVRVVYTFSPNRAKGTNTQYMTLTEADAESLRAYLNGLKEP
jgi:hypothetical protein